MEAHRTYSFKEKKSMIDLLDYDFAKKIVDLDEDKKDIAEHDVYDYYVKKQQGEMKNYLV
jgi:hypothetical protein